VATRIVAALAGEPYSAAHLVNMAAALLSRGGSCGGAPPATRAAHLENTFLNYYDYSRYSDYCQTMLTKCHN